MNATRRQIALGLIGAPLAAARFAPAARAAAYPNPDTLGINTHIAQGQPAGKVAAGLSFLGIRHIRDALPDGSLPQYLGLLKRGVRLTAVIGTRRPLPRTIAALEALERAHPGGLAAIEGPNEVNNFPVAYAGRAGTQAAIAFQNDLFGAVRASATLRRVPVIAFTDLALHDCQADFLNFHPYPKRGHTLAFRQLPLILQTARSSSTPDRPIQLTEFGYSTAEVSEQQQGDLLLSGWRDAVAAGIRRVFVYQLSDFYPDGPLGVRPAHHYGLFDLDYRPKLAAKAIAAALRG